MRRKLLQKIFKNLPKDFIQNAIRDVTIPTSAVFIDIHRHGLPKIFGTKFTAVFMYNYSNQVGVLRSPKEYQKFSSKLAKKINQNEEFTQELVEKLIFYSNWLYKFVKKYKTRKQFLKRHKEFFENYTLFFIYHQAVHFGGDYLSQMNITQKNKKALKKLQSAYHYNEMVAPEVEKYFSKLNIQNLLPQEINDKLISTIKAVPKNRSIIFCGKQIFVLTEEEAKWLKEKIDNKIDNFNKKRKSVTGRVVYKGTYQGRVRVVTILQKLNTIKKGEVLITTMTRPQYTTTLKKAGAIVTDEGGVICHAAILSRELAIPCVVGTKYATRVFKTGDLVEVDANKGIVRKL